MRVLCEKLRLAGDFDYRYLARNTPGYVGADLTSLTSAAGIIAVKRIFQGLGSDAPDVEMAEDQEHQESSEGAGAAATEQAEDGDTQVVLAPRITAREMVAGLPESVRHTSIAAFLERFPAPLPQSELDKLAITNEDFCQALSTVQPSSKREGFATVPDVTWADIGALYQTREELSMAIVQPIRRPELFSALGVAASSGVLLWGPPGCGKTLLAKAVANESRANFISIKGPELLNKYVGESEKGVRQLFSRARTSSPCVIFFDELDALVPKRDDALSEASARVVNTLLTELDGLESRVQTYVIAATNRPDMIDPAMCRPGRLDKLLYVDLPSPSERLDILLALTKSTPLAGPGDPNAVDLAALAHDSRANGYSGADLAALVREAAVLALRERIVSPLAYGDDAITEGKITVTQQHFTRALDRVLPSVGHEQRHKYEHLRHHFSRATRE